MKTRLLQFVAVSCLLALIWSCGGSGKTYSPSPGGTTGVSATTTGTTATTTGTTATTTGSTTGTADWTFVLGTQAAKTPSTPTDLGTLTTLNGTYAPGQTTPSVNILAVAKNGFNGKVTLSDVAGTAAGHIAAVPSVGSITPTTAGAPFTVSCTIPVTDSTGAGTIAFQGTDSLGRVKIAHIAFSVATVSGSFAPQTFGQSDLADSGPLVLTPVNGLTGPISISFDTNILSTDGAKQGDLKLPSTVTVTAPSSPVTLGTSPVTTQINFTWTAWNVGNYAVIAVLKKTGTAIAVRVPLEITVTSGNSGGGGYGLPYAAMWQYGPNRNGSVPYEYTLNTTNVNSTTFGRLFTVPLDAKTEGQPLYLQNVQISGATHNVVYVCTTNNSVYAFDADTGGSPLWHVNLGPAPAIGSEDGGNEALDGILSTPVINFNEGNYQDGATTTGVLYVCAKTTGLTPSRRLGTPVGLTYKLHGLNIVNGAETAGGPVAVTGTVQGKQGAVTLDAKNSYQRPALLLLDTTVYVAIGGQYGDPAPDRGWVFAYNALNLQQQQGVFTTCPDLLSGGGAGGQVGGSIWMSGGGISSDGQNVYVSSGNGDFNANTGGSDYGDSIIELSTPTLQVKGYFSPSNQLNLEEEDLDLGAGCPIVIQNGAGPTPLVLQTTKTNEVYVANASSLGGFNASGDKIHQELAVGTNREYLCSPAFCNGVVYMARGTSLQAFNISTGTLNSAPNATAPTMFNGYLPTPVVSFNGNVQPVVWAIEQSGANAVLHAYSASNLHEIYNSNIVAVRDAAGGFAKFAPPMVISGKVYVPCSNELAVYGPISNKTKKQKSATIKLH